jgi:hypothetical protein
MVTYLLGVSRYHPYKNKAGYPLYVDTLPCLMPTLLKEWEGSYLVFTAASDTFSKCTVRSVSVCRFSE